MTSSKRIQFPCLFVIDPQNNEATGDVLHYCSKACLDKASSSSKKDGKSTKAGSCGDAVDGSVCCNCSISLDEVKSRGILNLFVDKHESFFSRFPGDTYRNELLGGGGEWSIETEIDSCHSEDGESSNDYVLAFSLFEDVSLGQITPELTLNFYVAEVGVEEKHTFKISDAATLRLEIESVARSWEMDSFAVNAAEPLISMIFELKDVLGEASPINWK